MMRDYPHTEARHRVLRAVAEGVYIRTPTTVAQAGKFKRNPTLPFMHLSGAEGNALNRFWDASFLAVDENQEIEKGHLVILSESGQTLLNKWNRKGSQGNGE